jgi:hypothetical protein
MLLFSQVGTAASWASLGVSFDTYLVHVLAKFGSLAPTTLFSVNIQRLLEPGNGKVMEFFSQYWYRLILITQTAHCQAQVATYSCRVAKCKPEII